MSVPTIHVFYRFWFKWLDPLVLAPTIYALIVTPQVFLDAFVPASLSAYDPSQGFLFHQLAAMFVFVALALGGVLRVSNEIKVWRVITAGVLLVDLAMLASIYFSLKQQNRLSLGAMRAVDWGNVLFTGLVTTIRSLFLAGVGVQDNTKSKDL